MTADLTPEALHALAADRELLLRPDMNPPHSGAKRRILDNLPLLLAAVRERDELGRARAAQENFIADLRARRSHAEAERDALAAQVAAVEAACARWSRPSLSDACESVIDDVRAALNPQAAS